MDEEEFVSPAQKGYTVYSKSGCPNCTKIKKYLCENGAEMLYVNCDEYILENKEGFLKFIANLAEKSVRVFPIVFFERKFIGGYEDTEYHYSRLNAFSDNSFLF
jgi:glutaredoxin